MDSNNLEAAAHIVQLALTPVFLLSGIAALVNVFASRLARVADQVDLMSDRESDALRDQQLRLLKWRSHLLDAAVLLSGLGGACTCAAVLDLFLGEVKWTNAAALLFPLFGGAILLTMTSLAAFVGEVFLATRGVRIEVKQTMGSYRPSFSAGRAPRAKKLEQHNCDEREVRSHQHSEGRDLDGNAL